MSKIADKYISPGGRTADYDRSALIDDIINAASFLLWAENEYFGGVDGKTAFKSMCRVMDIDCMELRKIVLQQY